MKKLTRTYLLLLLILPLYFLNAQSSEVSTASILIEAEQFATKGGWVVDQQFVDQMGSPYLLAHGMGKPVEPASTKITVTKLGDYQLWVRTKDWCPGNWNAPGRFKISINEVPDKAEFGTRRGWGWQKGSSFTLQKGITTISLVDLTGFEGRCDAIYLAADDNEVPPDMADELKQWRAKVDPKNHQISSEMEFQFIVVGGGIAGCAAAAKAASMGIPTALIHDRPILGGNASAEVRVHTLGIYGQSQDLLSQIDTEHWPNGSAKALLDDEKRHQYMENRENLTLFLNYRAYDVEMKGSKIQSVLAFHTSNGKRIRLSAPIFADTTGDGWIGYWAGAEYRYGREAKSDFDEGWDANGELWSPKIADNRVMGSSLLWYSNKSRKKSTFPEVPWAMPIAKDHQALAGEWYWEFSTNDLHQINDSEEIRDHLFRAIYGSFYNAKQDKRNRKNSLSWVGYLLGKRESRRLVGDYIVNLNDFRNSTQFADTVVAEEREIDVHYQLALTGNPSDFMSEALFLHTDRYFIPFRSLYSINIDNLMMAGRCFSSTHAALGGPRVMLTTGQMGVAVGAAASICSKEKTTPRGVYQNHLEKLLELTGWKN